MPASDLSILAAVDDPPPSAPQQEFRSAKEEQPYQSSSSSVVYQSPAPGQYQATNDSERLAEDNQSGTVYVQPTEQDDLYYIYYQEGSNSLGQQQLRQQQPQELSYENISFEEPLYYQNAAEEVGSLRENNRGVRQNTGGASSTRFSLQINGREHGFSHTTDH